MGGIGKRCVRTGRDTGHALGAVLLDKDRGFPASAILGSGHAAGRRHDSHRGIRGGRLVIAQPCTELIIEGLGLEQRRTLCLLRGGRAAFLSAAARAAGLRGREQGFSPHAREVICSDLTMGHRLDPVPAMDHDLHVRLDDIVTEAPEFLDILSTNNLLKEVAVNVVVLEEGRDPEEAAEKRVTLHPQLELRTLGGLLGNIKTRQDKDLQFPVDNLLAVLRRDSQPGLLRRLVRFPDKGSAIGKPL